MIRKLVLLGIILAVAYFVAERDKQNVSNLSGQAAKQHSSRVPHANNDNAVREGFDFYVLSLSWSPSFCASTGWQDNQQCSLGAKYGFIVHGLWPQHETGWPEFCPTPTDRVSADVVESTLDIMPSQGLILHQWRKHGSCSGLLPEAYFETTRKALEKITIPPEYIQPHTALMTQPDYIESRFMAINAGLKADMIHVTCRQQQLQEVRVCLDKNLTFRACPNLEYRTCSSTSIGIPPIGNNP